MKDWESHFRKMRRVQLSDDDRFSFGTVGGLRTVAELRDLVAAYDYSLSQTGQALSDNTPTLALHPQEYVLLLNDWNILRARYNAARAVAQSKLDSWFVLPESIEPAEVEYRGILKAVQLSYPELRTSPGDLVDIVSRLRKLADVKPDFSQMPQPRQGTDADLKILKIADDLQKATTPSKSTLVKLGVGAVALLVVLKRFSLF